MNAICYGIYLLFCISVILSQFMINASNSSTTCMAVELLYWSCTLKGEQVIIHQENEV